MEEEKLIKDEAKRKKEEIKKWEAKTSVPTLKTQSTKKKNLFQSFQVSFRLQIFNSKFSFPNFQLKSSVFKKIQTSYFMIKIPSLNFQNSKAQNFRF